MDGRGDRRGTEHACEHSGKDTQTLRAGGTRTRIEPKTTSNPSSDYGLRWGEGSPTRSNLLLSRTTGVCKMVIEPTGWGAKGAWDSHPGKPRNGAPSAEKNELQPWRKKRYCIPERDAARFCAQMEEILGVYVSPHSKDEPLICMDESSKQLLSDVFEPVAMQPGQPTCEDHHYQRNGVRALFMFFNPIEGWRRVGVRENRTRVDWAEEIKTLLTVDYPQAKKVRLVCDNLNTHHSASLYEAFPAEEARAYAQRLQFHYTPRNGSWLNMAEIELSVLAEQCLDRRIPTHETLVTEVSNWQRFRNQDAAKVTWRFSLDDARTKLAHLYPRPLK